MSRTSPTSIAPGRRGRRAVALVLLLAATTLPTSLRAADAVAAPAEASGPTAAELWEAGRDAYAAGDFAKAAADYESLARAGCSSIDLWYNLGTTYAQLGRPYEALWMLRRALYYDPLDRAATKNLDRVLLEIGESQSRRSAALEEVRAQLESTLGGGMARLRQLWLWLAAVALLAGTILHGAGRRTRRAVLRVAGLWLGAAGLAIALPWIVAAYRGPGDLPATVLRPADVYSGPDTANFTLLQTLGPGASIDVKSPDPINGFLEIDLPNGVAGFVDQGAIGMHGIGYEASNPR